jgi:hypothetical protein
LQRQRTDRHISKERDQREQTGNRGPHGGVRHTAIAYANAASEAIEERHDQHAVHRGAHGPRREVDITVGVLAYAADEGLRLKPSASDSPS